MARPRSQAFTATSLRELATSIREHAEKVEKVAGQLERACAKGKRGEIQVDYHTAVNDGLRSIRNFVRDAEGKIDNGKIELR